MAEFEEHLDDEQDEDDIVDDNGKGGDQFDNDEKSNNQNYMGLIVRKSCLWGFLTLRVSNQSPQPLRVAGKFEFYLFSKFTYDTFQIVNNKGADQTARMRRLDCACVVHKHQRQVFSRRGPYDLGHMISNNVAF